MKSLYFRVAVTLLGALSLSLLAFTLISDHIEERYINPVFEVMDQLELESAQSAWDKQGSAGVAAYMKHLNQLFGPSHYFLNSSGTDVVTGKSQAAFLPNFHAGLSRGFINGRFVVTHRSADGRYWLLSVGPQQPDRWEFSPYYFVVIGLTALLCWLAAVFVVRPIRNVTQTVVRFGQGDLSARTYLRRQDEIGWLARSFNNMAERLECLLLSERRLLEDISHELRSPLARMKLAIKLARSSTDPGAALDRVEREVTRIAALTSEIVEVTRLEGDPRLLKLESANLGEVIREAICDCCAEIEPRVCHIQFEDLFSRDSFCDRELIRRAIENLLRNALRYSPENTPIEVRLFQDSHNVRISVRDFGLGVPEKSLAQIFEPFFRVNEARDMESGGVGLGLSIVKRVVQLHNGTISAHNAYPGLLIEISLPL